jgi:hypothetical protein
MKIIVGVYKWILCLTGLHKLEELSGRESNGKMSRRITRRYCPNCHWTTNPKVSAWFELDRRKVA